ncbi:MAG: hypothetical protein WD709_06150, partial [Gammaproteobacteria bacterium]
MMIKFNFKITQKISAPTQKQVDAVQYWIVLFPDLNKAGDGDAFPYHELLKARRSVLSNDSTDQDAHITDLPNDKGSRVAYACIKADIKSFELLTLAR